LATYGYSVFNKKYIVMFLSCLLRGTLLNVRVSAPARLHLGDIDPFGIGRFGYAPILALNEPRIIIEASKNDSIEVSGIETEDSRVYVERIISEFNLPGAKIDILSIIPRHCGFGSTTQLALSIGTAVTKAYGIETDVVNLATALKRTSTGGLHTFQHGGFVVAGGLKIERGELIFNREKVLFPPLIFRYDFPEEWRFLIIKPFKVPKSPDGNVEEEAFKKLHIEQPPLALTHQAYFTLMAQLIPSVIEQNAESFGEALTNIQLLVGRMYQPVQGDVFNPASAWIISILRRNRALGVGQSSWGPIVYAFVENEKKGSELMNAIRTKVKGRAEMFLVKADNSGVDVSIKVS
jgi:beta-ribofuranosylaminobenzene 5'-phosphate synthase